jgi:hypothetical protein
MSRDRWSGTTLLTWFDLKLTCGFEEVFKIGFKLAWNEKN